MVLAASMRLADTVSITEHAEGISFCYIQNYIYVHLYIHI